MRQLKIKKDPKIVYLYNRTYYDDPSYYGWVLVGGIAIGIGSLFIVLALCGII